MLEKEENYILLLYVDCNTTLWYCASFTVIKVAEMTRKEAEKEGRSKREYLIQRVRRKVTLKAVSRSQSQMMSQTQI